MPNFDHYFGTSIDAVARAQEAWGRIQRQPAVIVVRRNNANLPAQTVRVEVNSTANAITGEGGGSSSVQTATVFGVRSHPTQADTDLKREDLFALNGSRYRVVQVSVLPGEIQALCEAQA